MMKQMLNTTQYKSGNSKIQFENLVIKCKIKTVYKMYSLTQRSITPEEGYGHALFEDIHLQ
jgi:hypothetical protein